MTADDIVKHATKLEFPYGDGSLVVSRIGSMYVAEMRNADSGDATTIRQLSDLKGLYLKRDGTFDRPGGMYFSHGYWNLAETPFAFRSLSELMRVAGIA